MTVPSAYTENDTMLLPDVTMLALNLMHQHGLIEQGWNFDWDRSKSRLGACHFGTKKKITLSALITPGQSRAKITNTLLHEIAHALVGSKAGHGPEWQAKALSIGCDGKRCGTAENPVDFRWYAVCETCGFKAGMHRAPNRVRACGKCYPHGFSVNHLLRWEQYGKVATVDEMPVRFREEWNRIQRHIQATPGSIERLEQAFNDLDPIYN